MKKFTQLNKNRKNFKSDEIVDSDIKPNNKQLQLNLPQSENNVGGVIGFFSKLFESREVAHIFHLQVKDGNAYSAHKSLEDYYEDILELIDDIIEVYQGQYGIIKEYDMINTKEAIDKDPVDYFEELANFIKNERKCISEEDTHLHSIIDEVVILIYKTLYKLKNLK
jgi:DNA-binding ferritin-like protein